MIKIIMKIIQHGVSFILYNIYNPITDIIILIIINIENVIQSGFISVASKNITNKFVNIISMVIKVTSIINIVFLIDIISNWFTIL